MPVHDILTGKRLGDGEAATYLFYQRINGIVDFKFGELTLEDVLYLKHILAEAEDEILAQFIGEDDGRQDADND